ncbi:sigma-54 dependent transcription regulator [Caballeronia udeis]|uniref:Sigma-54 dependent transcription regulator n=1 Tax=Caballeronia udeis TaxID=1232866 RepID=A0A158GJ84_9BURK|nr:sigma-54-dependent Fis family transcriptional regulator [Caballeronia udeis]SAL32136.1 sigma-54 dependent transcription regulator [Caballeronia udeis]
MEHNNEKTGGTVERGIPLFVPDVVADLHFPNIRDLAERLRFNPMDGRIWLDDRRMVLIHTEAFGSLRQELIEALGTEAARGLLTRMGYISGSRDAALARKIRGDDSAFDAFAVGPQLHALEGIVLVEPVKVEIDSTTGHYYGEFLWKDSSEDEAHVAIYGIGADPACWMQTGYACGYTSAFMGRRILYREIECRALGNAACRIVGKPAEEWEDADSDLKYLAPQSKGSRRVAATSTYEVAPAGKLDETPLSGHADDKLLQEGPIGSSAAYNAVLHKIFRVAATKATVLLTGESGVGKSMFAREVHRRSSRATKPFVEINCAAIPESLMESELFGAEKGAFTGAFASRAGKFESANEGTIFLDEISSLSLTAQAKLLKVLQIGELEHLGSSTTIQVDVRVIAATNDNLKSAIKNGLFREDLFYRLNVFPILIPSLRARKDDIPLLIEHFIKKFSQRHCRHLRGISSRALHLMLDYAWPGNIRELENVLERGVILADEFGTLEVSHLLSSDDALESKGAFGLSDLGSLVPDSISTDVQVDRRTKPNEPSYGLDDWAAQAVKMNKATLGEVDDALVRAALSAAKGNISEAARLLGLTRAQLDYRVKKSNG